MIYPRPELLKSYCSESYKCVEVHAISSSHVVCRHYFDRDSESYEIITFTREEFAINFMEYEQEYNGHLPLNPRRQYCAYCGTPLFIKEKSSIPCPNSRPDYFSQKDWISEMQSAMEISKDEHGPN